MRKYHFIIVITLTVMLAACGAGTTQTTNPPAGSAAGDDSPAGVFDDTHAADGEPVSASDDDQGYEADALPETTLALTSVCTALSECYPLVDADDCVVSLNTDQNALWAFGVDPQSYESFDAVQQAISDSDLVINAAELNSCLSAIDDVSCAEMSSDNAFNNGNASDYSRVYLMVPEEC